MTQTPLAPSLDADQLVTLLKSSFSGFDVFAKPFDYGARVLLRVVGPGDKVLIDAPVLVRDFRKPQVAVRRVRFLDDQAREANAANRS